MIGQTISHYKILEKLGEGGMGIVYKAQDTKLDRLVALKFLPPQLSASEQDKARFIQEAKAAAALNHPNVCSVIDIQEHDGQQFIVMEYVDGVTIRQKITDGRAGHVQPLRLEDVISYAIQIGEALQEAHSKGVVHRDIKADNVMVNTKNQIKVMDFGLAKLKGSLKLTRTSSTVGTLAYMAPEQIQGGEVDARSDIFSFGVLLFEMLTGKFPFRGEHEAALVYSIVNEEPEPIHRYRPEVSSELVHILNRTLEKNPDERYQSVTDMLIDLRRSKKETTRVTRTAEAYQTTEAGESLPIGKKWRNQAIFIGIGAFLIIAVTILILRSPFTPSPEPSQQRKVLVVLPFENLGSPDREYFVDGITEEITSRLSSLSSLGVIARSSAMQYKKTTKSIKEIGSELGVSHILQGTVRWETINGTTHVRVNPQLIKVSDGTQVWSQPAEAVLSSAFTLQSEIASKVATALDIALLQTERRSLEAAFTDNPEAYDYYLRGNEYQNRSYRKEDFEIAEQMFQKATQLDPKFAAAFAALSNTHSDMYWFYYDRTDERNLKAKETAERALQLDPELPDAHNAMGWYYYHSLLDYDNALKAFDMALRRQPNNTDVLNGVGAVKRRQGKTEEALESFLKAAEIDPRSPALALGAGETYMLLRRYADAERFYDRALSLSPDWFLLYHIKARLYLQWEGNTTKARSILNEAAQRKVGVDEPLVVDVTIAVDIFDGKYKNALERLANSKFNVVEDQFVFVPKELLFAMLYGYMNRPAQARSSYDSARVIIEREIRRHPEDARLHSTLGIIYAGLGRKTEAIREGKRGVDLLPISKEAWRGAVRVWDLAKIYIIVGEHQAAIDNLKQLLAMPSDLSVPLIRLDPIYNPLRSNPGFQKLLAEYE